ncbi:MAG: pseudouridine synthase [Pseudomonadota bacterium]
MSRVILFNKPFRVLSQFRAHENKQTLSAFFEDKALRIAGRLDYDSEGLLLLSDDGGLIHRITDPRHKLPKTYWAQLDGAVTDAALAALRDGVELKDGRTRPARVRQIDEPTSLWPREPPIRYRASIPTSWIELTITEGRNRQVRRMTAATGFPTLRLVRHAVGPWRLGDLPVGDNRSATREEMAAVSVRRRQHRRDGN